jgi:nicotinamidase/pyrazinamidase
MAEVIVVVDTQADFIRADGALPVAGAEEIVGPLAEWLRARTADDTAAIVFTFDTHFVETYPASAEAELFPIHCVKGTAGWDNLIDPLAMPPSIPCRTLEKGVFDMWAEDGLVLHDPHGVAPPIDRDTYFAKLRESGVERAIVVGVAADYCVRWAVEGLIARGFAVGIPAALTRGITRSIEQVVADDFHGLAAVI